MHSFLRATRCFLVGQVVNLRPIGNRPSGSVCNAGLYANCAAASSFSPTPVSLRTRASLIRKCTFRAAAAYANPSGRTFEMQLRSASVRPIRGS